MQAQATVPYTSRSIPAHAWRKARSVSQTCRVQLEKHFTEWKDYTGIQIGECKRRLKLLCFRCSGIWGLPFVIAIVEFMWSVAGLAPLVLDAEVVQILSPECPMKPRVIPTCALPYVVPMTVF